MFLTVNDCTLPAPSDPMRSVPSRNTSAITQVPMAKYPPWSRNANKATGIDRQATSRPARPMAMNGSTLCCSLSTKMV